MTDYLDAQIAEWDRYSAQYAEAETVSGPGSTLEFTAPLRAWLPGMLTSYGVRSILDLGCGDFGWLSTLDLTGVHYVGWDHQEVVITANRARYGNHFAAMNILTVSRLAAMDLIIARDLFIHLPNTQVATLLAKIRGSGSRYLLASNFHGADNTTVNNHDMNGFFYRPTDLEACPFHMPGRLEQLEEPGREPGREMVWFKL